MATVGGADRGGGAQLHHCIREAQPGWGAAWVSLWHGSLGATDCIAFRWWGCRGMRCMRGVRGPPCSFARVYRRRSSDSPRRPSPSMIVQ